MTDVATLATLDDIRAQLDTNTNDADADTTIILAAQAVTRRVKTFFNSYTFFPVTQTRWFNYKQVMVDDGARTLFLDAPLLSATTTTGFAGDALTAWDGTRAALDTADYMNDPVNETPVFRLKWLNINSDPFGSITYLPTARISIAGVWGYHNDYANAWDADTTLNGAIASTSATTFDVTSATNISAGQLLKVDSELIAVSSVSTNTLTVQRGVFGSTAATHLTAAPVSIWRVQDDVKRVATKWAAQLTARRGKFQTMQLDGLGVATKFPADMPEEAQIVFRQFPRFGRWGAA